MKPESKFRSGVIAAVTVNMLCATPVLAEETSTGHIDDSRLLTGQGTFVTSTQFDAMEMPPLPAVALKSRKARSQTNRHRRNARNPPEIPTPMSVTSYAPAANRPWRRCLR